MEKEIFKKENFVDMDSMHDSYVSKIYNDANTLIIEYEDLDKGVLGSDGNPYYKNKKLTIKYECENYDEFNSYFDMIICSNKKYRYIELDKFIKNCKDYILRSYKFSLDSFGGLTLYFDVDRNKNGKRKATKYYSLMIRLDPIKIEYIWE